MSDALYVQALAEDCRRAMQPRDIVPGSIVTCADDVHEAWIERRRVVSCTAGFVVRLFARDEHRSGAVKEWTCATEADAWAMLLRLEFSLNPVGENV